MKLKIIYFLLPLLTLIYFLLQGNFSKSLSVIYVILIVSVLLFLRKKLPFLKNGSFNMIIIFVITSMFFGKTLNAYAIIPYYDKLLHFISGFIIAPIGYDLFIYLKKDNQSKLLLFLFTVLFSASLASLWEIFEFTSDSLFNTLSQNNSLSDTMIDIILGTASGIISALLLIFR